MKDIKDILKDLDLDLSNPEVVKAASEAIMQILAGRMGDDPETLKDRLGKKAQRSDDSDDDKEPIDLGTIEQEIDPNLIQPPQRGSGSGSDVETEIEDEDDVLSKVKQLGDSDNNQDNNGDGNGNGENGDNNQQPPANNQDLPDDNSDSPFDDADDTPNSIPSEKPDEESSSGSSGSEDEEVSDETSGSSGGTDDESAEGTGEETTDEENDNADLDSSGTGKPTDGADEEGLGDDTGVGDGTESDDVDDSEDSDSDFTSKVSGKNPKNESQQIQIGRTLKAAQKAQEKAEDAGQDAIASLLEKCQEMLEDMLDELESDPNSEINEQKLSQVIQKTLDAISEVDKAGLTFKSDEERERQVKQIKDTMSDTATAAELSAEDVEQIRADKQAIVNNKKEIDKYASRGRSSFKGFEDFVLSLRKALAMQVESEKVKAGSWAAINRRYDGTSVVKPGIKNKTLPNTRVPVIDFYFDCSASWDSYDLEKGNEALGKIAQLEADGEIKINVFYFADGVHADSETPRHEGGTGAWNDIIDNIILTKATNVVIMTDRDMQWQCNTPPHKGYKVSGFVWFLWKDGANAQNLPQLLQGRCGTMQFAFDSN